MIDEVTKLLIDVASAEIRPRFGRLAADEVTQKAPGDLVTLADRQAERLISRGLREILDVPVVGEEAVAEDPGLIFALETAEKCWVVDPIDGTTNFVAGRPEYAVMAALVRAGEPVAGWIVVPETGQVYVAEHGAGTFRDGIRVLRSAPRVVTPAGLRGAAPTRRLDADGRAHLVRVADQFAELGPGAGCAGVNYTWLVDGVLDFVLYQRSFPWDHAAGVVLLEEVGGTSVRPDGAPYRLSDDSHDQLLNVAALVTQPAIQAAMRAE
ncbi:inositol monophosphatase family protein [Nocardia takedensis]|uniref:inositol monophosphatase family protein n=1 Tax=Nocardia takedensis TaxID=259390 RepID=UPI003F773F61